MWYSFSFITAGGLKIIGTERHESRRIDNQLRGRSGRQGDMGESKFYIGLDANSIIMFLMFSFKLCPSNTCLLCEYIICAVEKAQKRVEGRNFSIRKHVLQYDDVMNTQREIIYSQRRQVLDGQSLKENIKNMIICFSI